MDQTAFIAEHLAETSGFTIHLSPVQIFIGLGLLVVILLSNAKSLLFMWHVNIPLPFPNPVLFSHTNRGHRDDSYFNLHGISYSSVHDLQ
jgi:hypothetical protein